MIKVHQQKPGERDRDGIRINITLRFNLATGKADIHEIVYELKKLRNPMILKILEQILRGYNDLISERL
jgi:hypothetical protein